MSYFRYTIYIISLGLYANLSECGKFYIIGTGNTQPIDISESSPSDHPTVDEDQYEDIIAPENLSKCYKHFGSIYESNQHKQQCIEELKNTLIKRSSRFYDQDTVDLILPYYLKYFQELQETTPEKAFVDLTKKDSEDLRSKRKEKLYHNTLKTDGDDWNPVMIKKDQDQPKTWGETLGQKFYELMNLNTFKHRDKNSKKPRCRLTNKNLRKFGLRSPKFRASSSQSESSEEQPTIKKRGRPKRFKIVPQNTDSTEVSEPETPENDETAEDSSTEEIDIIQSADSDLSSPEEVKPKKKQKEKNTDKYAYIQGRNRLFGINGRRQRLQYFMPKRYHWDQSDLPNLGYFWFNGPRGRYPDPYRID